MPTFLNALFKTSPIADEALEGEIFFILALSGIPTSYSYLKS
jgi:hypothetical protein